MHSKLQCNEWAGGLAEPPFKVAGVLAFSTTLPHSSNAAPLAGDAPP
ncbi:MAG: hypothetical protein AAF975_01140 [Spirochaetota bacterium]